ncbi:heavy-metal-associated domain-containing protein [Rubrobacter aplysinae]|uniref:heavy-metal-associated domain-containing protein n=1 Tax=Rubrobacter aplysinae TaxID=909625 RepID=UPI00064BC80D|nr:heavy metal-associated domain-containing protein [Rubrobacter aplysinae]
MPDVTLSLKQAPDTGDAERLERALKRLDYVSLASVDAEKELVAVSYTGGADELAEIGRALREAGFEYEPTPGADHVEDPGN